MVFQSYAIWPHMTVFENVAFPLRLRSAKPNRAEIKDRVAKALSLVHLGGLEDRPAPYLSGGQQQRLALARALVPSRACCCSTSRSPISTPSCARRCGSRFAQVVERLGVTTLFVTHEQIEALTMSDVMSVMNDGRIIQEGSPAEIYAKPKGAFVADFIGRSNFLAGTARGTDGGVTEVETAHGVLRCQLP